MTMNLEHQLEMKEIQNWMLLYGLGKKNGKVIPYPSAEYVHSNLLSSPVSNPMYLNISRKFERNAALKGDKSWELLAHWYIEGLAVEGYEENSPNPLEKATVKVKDLKQFLERSQYPSPDWLASTLGLTNQAISHDSSEAPTVPADEDSKEYPPQLKALILAWRTNWKNADPEDRTGCPKKNDVEAWLIEQEFSGVTAKAGATIIKPEWARKKMW
jgi:hypothetical protein